MAAVVSLPGRQDAARRLAATSLRNARLAAETAERHLDEVVLALVAGTDEMSDINDRSRAIIREARENAFAARRRLDEVRFALLEPDADTLTPNDEDDLATALQACLVANEMGRTGGGDFDRQTPACVGVRTGW